MVNWDDLILPEVAGDMAADDSCGNGEADLWHGLDGLDLGLSLWTAEGTLIRCNSTFSALFGNPTEACRSGAALQQILMLASMQHAGRDQAPAWVERLLSAHRNGGEAEWRGPDGRWWQARFGILEQGQRICRVLNISHQKRLEQEIRQLAEVSERDVPLAKGLAHMGHELRTPLNAILGFSDLIRSEAIGPLGHPSYAEYANDIHDSGQILLTAVDRIALLVKLEAGLVRPQSVEVSAQVLIAMALETVGPVAAAAGVTVNSVGPETDAVLFADRFLVSSMLTYLLENAVAATAAPGAVDLHCLRNNSGGLVFEVRDRGHGIAPEAIAAVREPFVRYDSANARCPAGVGMGLPVADRMAGLLACTIELESQPDAGTVARLIVPADRVISP